MAEEVAKKRKIKARQRTQEKVAREGRTCGAGQFSRASPLSFTFGPHFWYH